MEVRPISSFVFCKIEVLALDENGLPPRAMPSFSPPPQPNSSEMVAVTTTANGTDTLAPESFSAEVSAEMLPSAVCMDSALRGTGSQPPHTAANSIAETWAHAADSPIFVAVCSQLILSPHEWLPAAAAHTASVHEAVPQRMGGDGGGDGDRDGGGSDGGGEDGSGGEGVSAVQMHPSWLWSGGDDGGNEAGGDKASGGVVHLQTASEVDWSVAQS